MLQYLSDVTPIVQGEAQQSNKEEADSSQQKESVEQDDQPKDVRTIMDVENFHRLVVSARSVAITRPSNLVRYATVPTQEDLGRKGELVVRTISQPTGVCVTN